MFELADRLVGIYKTHDCTKSVTLDPWKLAEDFNNKIKEVHNIDMNAEWTSDGFVDSGYSVV